MQNDFVHFDHENQTITVNFTDKKPLAIHHHDPNLKISYFSTGHGGQNVNKHQNGVHLTYQIPPEYRRASVRTQEILVRCNEQRHQHQNLMAAFKHLAEKLHDYFYIPPVRRPTRLPGYAKMKRLNEKKRQSFKKQERQIKQDINP